MTFQSILKPLFFFCSLFFYLQSSAAFFQKTTNDSLELTTFVKLTPAEFTNVTGKNLSLTERMYLRKIQKKISRNLKKNKEVKLSDYYDPVTKKFKLDPNWFVLGILIGPFAWLFSLTTKQKKNSKKSVLLGLPLFILWFGLAFLF